MTQKPIELQGSSHSADKYEVRKWKKKKFKFEKGLLEPGENFSYKKAFEDGLKQKKEMYTLFSIPTFQDTDSLSLLYQYIVSEQFLQYNRANLLSCFCFLST